MAMIECRRCNSPYCDGCNIYTLSKMLHNGELDCLMDEHHSIVRTPESLRPKGEWALETHSFYVDTYDESSELSVYITAHCSNCGCKHPYRYEVFGRRLYPPDDVEEYTLAEFRFDQRAEEEKLLAEFKQKEYNFANFCPNCGIEMRGEDDG